MRLIAILSMVLECFCIYIILRTRRLGKDTTISQHAASRRWTYWLFALSLSTFGSLLIVYLLRDFGPQFGLPIIFYIALILGWICLILTAWIPDKDSSMKLNNPHWLAAYAMANTMMITMLSLVFAHHVNMLTRTLAGITASWYAYTLYLGVFGKRSSKSVLVYQSVNILSFFAILIGVSFLG
jgi:hypothetical protein